MRIVLLIILIVLIIFTSLSFLQDNEGDETLKTTVNLKSVNGNEQFYEKIGATKKEKEVINNEKQINQNEESLIINRQNESIEKIKEPTSIILPENNIEFEIINWKLIGQQKNVLIIDLKIKNGFQKNIKDLKKNIKCNTLNKNKESLNEIITDIDIHIKEKSEIIITDINFGFVDIDTEDIVCSILDYQEKKSIDTTLKPLKELSKKSNNINNNNTQQGGFIYSSGEIKEDEDDFILPNLN
jgi:hypothetical protein